MSELKFIFTGTPGAGKTTAIASISDHPPVSTDMSATDELSEIKDQTTVAMDFGEFTLENGERIFLYGTPGQERFSYMWDILVEGGLGLIILIDNTRLSPLDDLQIYLDSFRNFIAKTGAVIAITRTDLKSEPSLEMYQDVLSAKGVVLPIMAADPRNKNDVLLLLDMLMSVVEMNKPNYDLEVPGNDYDDALLSF